MVEGSRPPRPLNLWTPGQTKNSWRCPLCVGEFHDDRRICKPMWAYTDIKATHQVATNCFPIILEHRKRIESSNCVAETHNSWCNTNSSQYNYYNANPATDLYTCTQTSVITIGLKAKNCVYRPRYRIQLHRIDRQRGLHNARRFTTLSVVQKQFFTSSSAIAEGPRDALSQLKSCQLLHNCTKNHI